MPSPIPLQPGSFYHVYNRGTNGEDLFKEEQNYSYFLKLYAYHIEPVAETFAYCLMRNHFHLLLRVRSVEETVRVSETLTVSRDPPRSRLPSPSQSLSNLFNAYTKAINKAYQRTGSLFEHPYHRSLVDNDCYYARLVVYIHNNPQKHGFVDDYREWKWSSYHALLSHQPTHLSRSEVLNWFGGTQPFQASHQHGIDRMTLAEEDFN